MILAVKNLRNSHHTSVVGAYFLASSISPKFPNSQTILSIARRQPYFKILEFCFNKTLGKFLDITVKPEFRVIF